MFGSVKPLGGALMDHAYHMREQKIQDLGGLFRVKTRKASYGFGGYFVYIYLCLGVFLNL